VKKYIDIIRKTLDLADTCLEGLEHVKACINKGRFEDGLIMLHDSVQGYYHMEKALVPVLAKLPANGMGPLSEALRNALDAVISIQERGERAKVLELMQFVVVPAYKKWHTELNRCLRPYVAS
jgi:hypothetical protein